MLFFSGTSIRTDPKNMDINVEGKDPQSKLKEWRGCCYCNQAILTPDQVSSCKIHGCSYRYINHPKKELERVDSSPSRAERNRSHFIEKPLEQVEKTSFCPHSCCSRQKSIEDAFTPGTPEATGSNSSEGNRTEYYPQVNTSRK